MDAANNAVNLYVDGNQAGTSSVWSANQNITGLFLGQRGDGTHFNRSMIDEVALWNRPLSPSEVTQVYQRGASRLLFQVRSCSISNCSDHTSASTGWMGPDGTNQSYFTELANNSTTSPLMSFTNFGLSIPNEPYFQYQTFFETDSSTLTKGPAMKTVVVGPNHYDNSSPTVSNSSGLNFSTLTKMLETLGTNGCAGSMGSGLDVLQYNLSVNGSTWYYWTSLGGWQTATGNYTDSTPASVLSANLPSFANQVGTGKLYFKAFLNSDGFTPCQLADLTFTGTH